MLLLLSERELAFGGFGFDAQFFESGAKQPTRKDGHHPIIWMQCGPVRHRVSAKAEANRRPFSHTVIVRPTAFLPAAPASSDKREQFHALCDDLISDELRNSRICED